jgi:hypothetical protein
LGLQTNDKLMSTMMDDRFEIYSAVDAVRCLYLARVAQREGHEEAARRLHANSVEWVDKFLSGGGRARSVPRISET